MASIGRIAGLPFEFTDEINGLIQRMGTLTPFVAPAVEPAVLAPFCAVGDSLNLSGPAGCGKTFLAADVLLGAIAPEREGRALGGLFRFDTKLLGGGPVAIIDGESGIARWNSILRRKLEAEGLGSDERLRAVKHITPSKFGIQTKTNWERASLNLAQALSAAGVHFIIGDTLARIWAPDDVISIDWVQRGLVPFRDACREYGITSLWLSHTKRKGKPNDPDAVGPIGTSFQECQVDAQIVLSRSKGQPGLVLTHQKSRRSFWIQQGAKVALHFKRGLGYEPQDGWQHEWPHDCPSVDDMDLEVGPSTRSQISQILRDAAPGCVSRHDLERRLGLKERAVRKQLNALAEAGKAERVGNGSDTQWKWKGPC